MKSSMQEFFSLEEIDRVAGAVRGRISVDPKVAVILGSGLGSLVKSVGDATDDPNPGTPVLAGLHSGRS